MVKKIVCQFKRKYDRNRENMTLQQSRGKVIGLIVSTFDDQALR